MKFKPLEEFKHGHMTYEPGNTYDSEKHGLSEAEVMQFHANGWAEVEGKDAPPPRQVKGAVVQPDNSKVGHSAQEA